MRLVWYSDIAHEAARTAMWDQGIVYVGICVCVFQCVRAGLAVYCSSVIAIQLLKWLGGLQAVIAADPNNRI